MTAPRQEKPRQPDRSERLKAALKANMGRRKAQARARAQAEEAVQEGDTGSEQKE